MGLLVEIEKCIDMKNVAVNPRDVTTVFKVDKGKSIYPEYFDKEYVCIKMINGSIINTEMSLEEVFKKLDVA